MMLADVFVSTFVAPQDEDDHNKSRLIEDLVDHAPVSDAEPMERRALDLNRAMWTRLDFERGERRA